METIAAHAAAKAKLILQLHQKLYPLLEQNLAIVFHDIEMPLIKVLADMELAGVLLDTDSLKKHGTRLKDRIIQLEKEAVSIVGKSFNLNSPKQLQEILFDELKLPIQLKPQQGSRQPLNQYYKN